MHKSKCERMNNHIVFGTGFGESIGCEEIELWPMEEDWI